MTAPLRILADDLTGALDAAAPFASPERPVEVPWAESPLRGEGSFAATPESRNSDPEEAVRRTLRTFDRLRGSEPGALWFKKVDSVLRGHPVAEVAALIRTETFRRCVVAPAFPEMGRITRNGRQVLLGPEGECTVGPQDLVTAFAEEGLTTGSADAPPGAGPMVIVADAATPADLLDVVQAHAASEGVLWVGSRGLAAALAGPSSFRPVPPVGLVVVGTSHPATRSQIRAIEAEVTRVGPDDVPGLDAAKPLLIDPVPNAVDAAGTRQALLKAFGRLARGPHHREGLIVVGGDTLSTILEATRTRSLEVLGEVGPGIPLVRVCGGALDGRRMVTKSGGFGPPELLRNLLAEHASSYA